MVSSCGSWVSSRAVPPTRDVENGCPFQSFQDRRTGLFEPGGRGREHDACHGLRHGGARAAGLPPAPSARAGRAAIRRARGDSAMGRLLRLEPDLDGSHELGAAAAVIDAPEGIDLPEEWADWTLEALTEKLDPKTGFWKNRCSTGSRRPTTIDLGGAAHFWWIYHHLGRRYRIRRRSSPASSPCRGTPGSGARVSSMARTPRASTSMPSTACDWRGCSSPRRPSARRSQILAALDRYACAADAHLDSEGSVERLFRTSHKLVGTLNALAELDLIGP